MKGDLEVLKNEVKNLKENNVKEHRDLKEAINEIKVIVEKALDNKANKWVEKWTYGVVFGLFGATIGFFIWLVTKGVI